VVEPEMEAEVVAGNSPKATTFNKVVTHSLPSSHKLDLLAYPTNLPCLSLEGFRLGNI